MKHPEKLAVVYNDRKHPATLFRRSILDHPIELKSYKKITWPHFFPVLMLTNQQFRNIQMPGEELFPMSFLQVAETWAAGVKKLQKFGVALSERKQR